MVAYGYLWWWHIYYHTHIFMNVIWYSYEVPTLQAGWLHLQTLGKASATRRQN